MFFSFYFLADVTLLYKSFYRSRNIGCGTTMTDDLTRRQFRWFRASVSHLAWRRYMYKKMIERRILW